MERIPSNTSWHLCQLEDGDFSSLHVIREYHWKLAFGDNTTLNDVAVAYRTGATEVHESWVSIIEGILKGIGSFPFREKLILIAERESGPFTLVDGNHRAVAFQLKAIESGDDSHLPGEMIVGISPDMAQCAWLNSS